MTRPRPREVEPVTNRLLVLQGVRLLTAVALPVITAITGNFDVIADPPGARVRGGDRRGGAGAPAGPEARPDARVVDGSRRRTRAGGGGGTDRWLPKSVGLPRVLARHRDHAARVVPDRARARDLVRAPARPRACGIRRRHHRDRAESERPVRAGRARPRSSCSRSPRRVSRGSTNGPCGTAARSSSGWSS